MDVSRIWSIVRRIKNRIGRYAVTGENAVDYVCGDGDALPLPLSAEEERIALEKIALGQEVERIKDKVLYHVKQASVNQDKIKELKNGKKNLQD